MSHSLPRLFSLLVAATWLAALFPRGAQAERPNILVLLTDDQVDIATGCYGNPQVQTPNMDRLAAEGTRFANHYNTTSICMASRASIMTGLYEYKTGCNFMHGALSRATFEQSYPVILRRAGYFTGFAGKFGFAVKESPQASERYNRDEDLPSADFDVWAGGPGQTHFETARNKGIAPYAAEYPHSTRAYAAWAHDFLIAAKQTGKPFCLSISFKAPHLPFTPDPAFDHVYADVTFKKPDNYGVANGTHLAPHTRTGRQFHEYRFWVESEASYQKSIRAYHQLIHGVDVALGMIRDALQTEGLAHNTVILFTSDNGYNCGAHGFGDKIFPYEEASRSPLIIYDPRLPKAERGRHRATVTANIDIAPTILDLAGLPIPEHIDGTSLVPLLRAPDPLARTSVALMNMWGNPEIQALAVVTSDWKYIFWGYESAELPATEELFHLAVDRQEMHNLARDPRHAAQLQAMRALYDTHFEHLRHHGVDHNDYAKYKTLFNRHAPGP